MTAKIASLDDLSQALTAAVEEGLARHATGAILDFATTEANLRASLAPLVLPHHERTILATLLVGEVRATSALDRLSVVHFHGDRCHAFSLLRRNTEARSAQWLYQELRAVYRTPAATVERLVEEIDRAPVAAVPAIFAAVVDELIAAHELSEYARTVRLLLGQARAAAQGHDPSRFVGAIDAAGLRTALREAGAVLAPALKAVEGGAL